MGGQIVGGRGCGKGQGGGGQEGWGKEGGVRMGARGWNLYLNEILNKTGIVTGLGCRNEWESPILEGFPHCNDITFSKICHNLAKKSPKTRRREISANYLCKKEQPS